VTQVIASELLLAGSDESALVARAQGGDQPAFEALLSPRLDRLLRLTFSIVSNDADASDAVQEACLRAWRELPRLRDPDRFEAWLWQIAINACRSALRTRRRASVREIAVETMPDGFEIPGSGRPLADELSDIDLVQRAFRRLDADKRAILVLHHVEERSITEIGQLLAIPEGTAKWRLFSARKALTRALEVERR
jgi:RNA polymerase sigma-70 factor (ECF subfamily)